MSILQVEKLGGLANFGGMRSRIRSVGRIDTTALSPDDQKAIDELFRSSGTPDSNIADSFRFRVSRLSVNGTENIEVSETCIPAALASCVKDEFV